VFHVDGAQPAASMSFERWLRRWTVAAWLALVQPRDAVRSEPERDALVLRTVKAATLTEAQVAASAIDAGTSQIALHLGARHVLRVCNAYPDNGNLKIFSNDQELTSFMGLGYKSCQEWKELHIQAGNVLEFRLGGLSAGALRFSEVPWDNAVVAVVVYDVIRMTGRSFDSQVFQAGVAETQVGVFDAFHGGTRAKMWIKDSGEMRT